MVIYIQDVLARRRDAAPRTQPCLLAVGGGHAQPATPSRSVRQAALTPTLMIGHGDTASNILPCTTADMMTLYAEASLI